MYYKSKSYWFVDSISLFSGIFFTEFITVHSMPAFSIPYPSPNLSSQKAPLFLLYTTLLVNPLHPSFMVSPKKNRIPAAVCKSGIKTCFKWSCMPCFHFFLLLDAINLICFGCKWYYHFFVK